MARRRKKAIIPGLTFSWKRATGATAAKRKIARAAGIPTTKAGRQRKIGKMVTGGGCLLYIFIPFGIIAAIIWALL